MSLNNHSVDPSSIVGFKFEKELVDRAIANS